MIPQNIWILKANEIQNDDKNKKIPSLDRWSPKQASSAAHVYLHLFLRLLQHHHHRILTQHDSGERELLFLIIIYSTDLVVCFTCC